MANSFMANIAASRDLTSPMLVFFLGSGIMPLAMGMIAILKTPSTDLRAEKVGQKIPHPHLRTGNLTLSPCKSSSCQILFMFLFTVQINQHIELLITRWSVIVKIPFMKTFLCYIFSHLQHCAR